MQNNSQNQLLQSLWKINEANSQLLESLSNVHNSKIQNEIIFDISENKNKQHEDNFQKISQFENLSIQSEQSIKLNNTKYSMIQQDQDLKQNEIKTGDFKKLSIDDLDHFIYQPKNISKPLILKKNSNQFMQICEENKQMKRLFLKYFYDYQTFTNLILNNNFEKLFENLLEFVNELVQKVNSFDIEKLIDNRKYNQSKENNYFKNFIQSQPQEQKELKFDQRKFHLDLQKIELQNTCQDLNITSVSFDQIKMNTNRQKSKNPSSNEQISPNRFTDSKMQLMPCLQKKSSKSVDYFNSSKSPIKPSQNKTLYIEHLKGRRHFEQNDDNLKIH